MKKCIKHLVLVIMILSILSPSVLAAVYTNEYISSGGGYIHRWGPGDISVEFNVVGTGMMDTIGAHSVTVFRVKGETRDSAHDDIIATYWYETYPGMMITDDFFYSSSIRLQVEPGERYYAVIVFYATLDGDGDSMAFCTRPIPA